jgi:hypothetical protein
VRRLGCCGETAASRMLHPNRVNRLRRNTHAGLSFASYSYLYDPRSRYGELMPELSRN